MNDFDNDRYHQPESACKSGCRAAVPKELEVESVCVQHFILSIESECQLMRREAATELATITRRREIDSYVKATALKLSEVATSNTRLSDDMKKKVLTTFLTLMNLQESVDRSRTRPLLQRRQKPVEPAGLSTALAL
ncbi:MAG TPA: hypothetical protein VG322_02480 [Candidatus Acidoferrales bacterium]|jgi:hypothetical protein|nr:hypothetical protein [Candidatus Acidoferrales bacterium]